MEPDGGSYITSRDWRRDGDVALGSQVTVLGGASKGLLWGQALEKRATGSDRRSLVLLLLDFRDRVQVAEPRLCRAKPILYLRRQLAALSRGPQTDVVDFRPVTDGGRVNCRATLGTERLFAFGTAVPGFDIDLRFSREQPEGLVRNKNNGAKCRA